MALKNVDLKKNQIGIARLLLACTTAGGKNVRLDVSGALRRWRERVKAEEEKPLPVPKKEA